MSTPSPDKQRIARILKVNHVGEYGAVRIYGAQIALSRKRFPDIAAELDGLRAHEIEHCALFRDAMPTREARPCRLLWLSSAGGWVLGAVTALLGRQAIWRCTEAVEDVVHHHLTDQVAYLQDRDPPLSRLIASIQEEEAAHLALALALARLHQPGPTRQALDRTIRWTVEALIWLSTHGDSARMRRELAS